MTQQTPVYGIKYIVPGEPIRNTRQALEDNAKTIEAALVAGGIAPAGAPDIATLSGRVTVLEGIRDTEANIKLMTAGRTLHDIAHATDTKAVGIWDGTRWTFHDTQWQAFTPVISTGVLPGTVATLGNGFLSAEYFRRGRLITYRGLFQIGSTTAYNGGSGALRFTYPTGYLPKLLSTAFLDMQGIGWVKPAAGSYNMLWAGTDIPGATVTNRRVCFLNAANPSIAVTSTPGTFGVGNVNDAIGWEVTYHTEFEA
jgi:hypothetical protein